MSKCDLRVKLGDVTLKNPVMPASGTYDYFEDYSTLVNIESLGAAILKTVRRHPYEGNKPPRIAEVRAGLINSVGIPSKGIERFVAEDLPSYTDFPVPVIISLAGECT